MRRADVAVVGAGPAGLTAALAAAAHGARVALIDSQDRPGGQLIKQTHKFFGTQRLYAGTRGVDIARILSRRVSAEPRIELLLQTQALGVYADGVLALETGQPSRGTWELGFGSLIVATGAFERGLLFENNDLPGVYGAGAVQTLMNTHGVLPGRRVLMVGSGNIGLIVSYQLLQAGVDVAAVVELMPRLGGYEVHARRLERLGVPIWFSTTVVRAIGRDGVEAAVVARVDQRGVPVPGTEICLEADVICVAVGLSPLVDLLWHSGCRMKFVGELGGYVPVRTQRMRAVGCKWPVYVAGDSAGIEEASTAMLEGEVAGVSAATGDRADVGSALSQLGELRSCGRSARLVAGLARVTEPEYRGEQELGDGGGCRVGRPPVDRALVGPARAGVEQALVGPARPGPWAFLECPEEIPCDPCFTACPRGAIKPRGDSVVSTPVVDHGLCDGCGVCVAICPGQAAFVADLSGAGAVAERAGRATISLPYEFLPLPAVGDEVGALSSRGSPLGSVRVERVRVAKRFDRTAVITVSGDTATVLATRAITVAGGGRCVSRPRRVAADQGAPPPPGG